jgi:hypothetical protein
MSSRYNDALLLLVGRRLTFPMKDTPVTYRLLLLLLASFLAFAITGAVADSPPEISAERVKAGVAYLSSDRLEGRGPGTRGEILATEYIADGFKAAGLEPIGARGTYYQPVPLMRVVTSPKSTLQAVKRGTTLDIRANALHTVQFYT